MLVMDKERTKFKCTNEMRYYSEWFPSPVQGCSDRVKKCLICREYVDARRSVGGKECLVCSEVRNIRLLHIR